jgi:hypothetical protein
MGIEWRLREVEEANRAGAAATTNYSTATTAASAAPAASFLSPIRTNDFLQFSTDDNRGLAPIERGSANDCSDQFLSSCCICRKFHWVHLMVPGHKRLRSALCSRCTGSKLWSNRSPKSNTNRLPGAKSPTSFRVCSKHGLDSVRHKRINQTPYRMSRAKA